MAQDAGHRTQDAGRQDVSGLAAGSQDSLSQVCRVSGHQVGPGRRVRTPGTSQSLPPCRLRTRAHGRRRARGGRARAFPMLHAGPLVRWPEGPLLARRRRGQPWYLLAYDICSTRLAQRPVRLDQSGSGLEANRCERALGAGPWAGWASWERPTEAPRSRGPPGPPGHRAHRSWESWDGGNPQGNRRLAGFTKFA